MALWPTTKGKRAPVKERNADAIFRFFTGARLPFVALSL